MTNLETIRKSKKLTRRELALLSGVKEITDPYHIEGSLKYKDEETQETIRYTWTGYIDMWLADSSISLHYWYEYASGKHFLVVGTHS